MRERVPNTSQDARNRIATFLSSETRSAGAFCVRHGRSNSREHGVNYTLWQKYSGDARKTVKGFSRPYKRFNVSRGKVSSSWLRGHKGCYVCGKDHLARTKHTKTEISDAIQRLKRKDPTAMISVDDLAFITGELSIDEISSEDHEGEDVVFSENVQDDADSTYITEDAMNLNKSEEIRRANSAFMHGTSFANDHFKKLLTMTAELSAGEGPVFKGIYIDTCANRSSVMSYSQYKAYCEEFKVPCSISREESRILRGIGGKSSSIGTAIILVPFRDLNLVLDIKFQIVSDNVPTLLSMKDMLDNGLDISIQQKEVKFKHLMHPLIMENYFLIHRWRPGDMAFSLYTETELRKLHRVFGHPTVSSFTNLLRRARPDDMTADIRKAVEEIAKQCLTCATNSSRPRRFKTTVGS